jgi:hypothetical protein
MNDRTEFLAAIAAAGFVFAIIVAPEPLLVLALGLFGLGLVARLGEAIHVPAREVHNRR